MRDEGLWVVSSLFWDYVPDAVVVLDKEQHRSRVCNRHDLDWDTTSEVRQIVQSYKHDVPLYRDWGALIAAYALAAREDAKPLLSRRLGYPSTGSGGGI